MPEIAELAAGPRDRVPEVRDAYRYLRGAHSTVSGIFAAHSTVSDARRSLNTRTTGRAHSDEVDLLRAAIVFTSSGLDASMSRLVTDVGRYLIPRPGTAARQHYYTFIRQELGAAKVDANLINAIASEDVENSLLSHYLAQKTKASFQGSGDLKKRVRNVLGIPSSRVTDAQMQVLDDFFIARNSIAHSMDFKNLDTSGSQARIHRAPDDVVAFCDQAFSLASDMMHAAAEVITANR